MACYTGTDLTAPGGYNDSCAEMVTAFLWQAAFVLASTRKQCGKAGLLPCSIGGQTSLSDDQVTKAMDSCAQMLASRFDDNLGGFGSAPKFPRPSELNLLLLQHARAKAAGGPAEAGLQL